jgi:molybdopterin converting factor small subunit
LAPGAGLPPALVAVNQAYAELSQRLIAGDEVAIIPPVAGG